MIDLFYECEDITMVLQTMLTKQLPICLLLTFPLSFLNLSKSFCLVWQQYMKANPSKCHLLLSFKCPEVASINGIQVTSSTAETPLCIAIDFENHLPVVCNKVNRKNNALGRIVNYMSLEKR